MTKIIDNLFLGSLKVAQDLGFLRANKVQHILSCGIFNNINVKHVRRHKSLKLKDNHLEPISDYFPITCEFIDEALSRGETVLVHCLKGMSRSATVVTAYLMQHLKMDAEVALKMVQKAHPITFPNPHFRSELGKWQKVLEGTLSSANEDHFNNEDKLSGDLNSKEEEKEALQPNNETDLTGPHLHQDTKAVIVEMQIPSSQELRDPAVLFPISEL